MALEQQPAPTSPDDGKNSVSAAPGSGTPAAGERTYSDAEVQALIRERLDRQKRAIDADQERARKEADDRVLAEQGQFKALADKAQAEAAQLRPLAERATTLEALIAQHIDSILPKLPESLRLLLPKSLPVDEQYAWVIEAEKQAATLTRPAPAPGLGGNPPPASAISRQELQAQEKAAQRASGRYGF